MRNRSICQAIHNRRLLHFYYELDARTVEPHAYGITRENDEVLHAYQVAGGSRSKGKSRQYRGWKVFRIEEINRLTVLEQTFVKPRPGYNRSDKAMSRIFCQV
jgi:hypothetical protein